MHHATGTDGQRAAERAGQLGNFTKLLPPIRANADVKVASA